MPQLFLLHGFFKIFQHLEHFFPSAFFTETAISSISSNLKNSLLLLIFLALALEVIKNSDRFMSLVSFKYCSLK